MADDGGLLMSVSEPPFPNCPSESSPQHLTEPSSSNAHTVLKAVARATAVRPEPRELMVAGVFSLEDVKPRPS